MLYRSLLLVLLFCSVTMGETLRFQFGAADSSAPTGILDCYAHIGLSEGDSTVDWNNGDCGAQTMIVGKLAGGLNPLHRWGWVWLDMDEAMDSIQTGRWEASNCTLSVYAFDTYESSTQADSLTVKFYRNLRDLEVGNSCDEFEEGALCWNYYHYDDDAWQTPGGSGSSDRDFAPDYTQKVYDDITFGWVRFLFDNLIDAMAVADLNEGFQMNITGETSFATSHMEMCPTEYGSSVSMWAVINLESVGGEGSPRRRKILNSMLSGVMEIWLPSIQF